MSIRVRSTHVVSHAPFNTHTLMLQSLKQFARTFVRRRSRTDFLAGLDSGKRLLINEIKGKRLTYLSDRKLRSIVEAVEFIEVHQVPGLIIEAGCALGGSAILITKTKQPERLLRVYDVFGMIPPPTKEDTADVHERYKTIVEGKSTGIAGDPYYGYEDDLYSKVVSNFKAFDAAPDESQVELIKGLLQDTLWVTGPVALAHVDVDWYEPVMTCLERIYPMLSVGGSIILDDYHDWGGCRKATDEFLRRYTSTFQLDDSAGSLKITKIRAERQMTVELAATSASAFAQSR